MHSPRPNSRLARSLFRARTLSLAAALGLCAAGGVVGGCSTAPDAALAGPKYPANKPQYMTLDIQVVRQPANIRLTNTTAFAFGRSRLWVNRFYSREIEGLAVGQTIDLSLWDFRDQFGDEFRAGGFFATRRPQVVELVQLETGDAIFGLVAVGKEGG